MSRHLEIWNPERWNFGKDLLNLQNEMERWMDSIASVRRKDMVFTPPCDVEETETYYQIHMDVPGMKKENMKISFADNVLTVTGEHTEQKKEERKNKKVIERYEGSFERSFLLPNTAASEKIEARCEDGVLSISIPKVAKAVMKNIPIAEGRTLPKKNEKEVSKLSSEMSKASAA